MWLDLNWNCYAKIVIREKETLEGINVCIKKSRVVENVGREIVKCHWFDERAMK